MTIETYLADRRALLATEVDMKVSADTRHAARGSIVRDEERQLAVIEAAARVIAWWAKDPYTQVEKIDGGNDLCAALDALTQRSRDE